MLTTFTGYPLNPIYPWVDTNWGSNLSCGFRSFLSSNLTLTFNLKCNLFDIPYTSLSLGSN
jgi:hypothetical protein